MELYHLTQLTSLHICFKDMVISEWFKPLAEKTVQLALDNCIVMKDVIEALDKSQNPLKRLEIFNESQGLPYWPTCVEHLRIESCDDMEVMLKGVVADRDYFTKLKTLLLEDLSKLERIWVGPVPQNCFSQLSKIHIEHCRRLKMVFTKGMSGVFNNLRSITAEDCHMMEVIIEAEEEGSNISGVISFPKLERLWLISLSTLTDVCSNGILHCPRLQELYVYDCPKLKKDPLHLRITDDQLHIIEEDLSE
ncbi:hypothetical protein NE237_025758 [Protea cynaroides]|uniref:Disease resistance protein At4g27190-like leucine-rich repeats domain-containing protein n=1 Tax=Protea cynaroides TaxID=273540 RepID=A0A9Q0H6U7_9MAGN|nr:hypothetical protein NE237_025758 [Protea cynaroides]